MNDTATLDFILGRLEKVKKSGSGWVARCPAHEDRNPSLSVTAAEDRLLLHCQAGCTPDAVVQSLGLTLSDLFDEPLASDKPEILETYDYTDAEGAVLYQVLRMVPKGFRQRRPDGNGGWTWNLEGQERVLYHLPQVLETVAKGGVVFVVEGESDANTLEEWGLTATTGSGGAGKWLPSYSETLKGARVIVLPDNDAPGHKYAALIVDGLKGIAAKCMSIDLPGLPEKGDVTDWARAGNTKEDLIRVIADRPNRIKSISDAMPWVQSHTRKDNPLPKGIPYPWPKVNQMTNGMHPGWLCILAGYTSHGKTAGAIEIAVEACDLGYTVLFVSLEMPIESLSIRIAQRFGMNSFHFYQGECNDWDRDAAKQAAQHDSLKRLKVVENTRTVREIADVIEEVKPDLVIIDYLGKMDMPGKDIRIAISKNTLDLSNLAKSAKVPILCLAQLRRNVGGDAAGSVPTEQDLKESSSIEQDADQVIFVWRERDPKTKVATDKGLFIVAKSRMGQIGTSGFYFDGARQVFHPVEEPA